MSSVVNTDHTDAYILNKRKYQILKNSAKYFLSFLVYKVLDTFVIKIEYFMVSSCIGLLCLKTIIFYEKSMVAVNTIFTSEPEWVLRWTRLLSSIANQNRMY